MNAQLAQYYAKQQEPIQGCLLALKDIILAVNPHITHQRKYQIPFFYYKDKKLSYLWVTKKKLLLGFVEDKKCQPPSLDTKSKDKFESILINPNADLPIVLIRQKLQYVINLYDKNAANDS
jgi:hypothetical protein